MGNCNGQDSATARTATATASTAPKGAGVKTFYTASFAPNPQLVDLVIRQKGLDIKKHEINILAADNRKPEMMKKNPSGQVPFFELTNGAIITDTIAMVEYLEEISPSTYSVFGKTAQERAHTRMWQRRVEEHIVYPTFSAFRFWTASDDCEGGFKNFFEGKAPVLIPGAWREMQEWAVNRLNWLEEQKKAAPSDFVCGNKITVVDYQLYTTLKFFAVEGFGNYIKDHDLPWAKAFMTRMKARAEVKASEEEIAKQG